MITSTSRSSGRSSQADLPHDRVRRVGIGRRHAGTTVLVLVHDLHVSAISTSGQPLWDPTLHPDRDTPDVNDVAGHL